ncbi:MAG: hypothetical protein ACK44Z_02935, partial [Pirellulaceae bacterium]
MDDLDVVVPAFALQDYIAGERGTGHGETIITATCCYRKILNLDCRECQCFQKDALSFNADRIRFRSSMEDHRIIRRSACIDIDTRGGFFDHPDFNRVSICASADIHRRWKICNRRRDADLVAPPECLHRQAFDTEIG